MRKSFDRVQPYHSPHRMAHGGATVAAIASNFSIVSIYNNSMGGHLIQLLDLEIGPTVSGAFDFGVLPGPIGALSTQSGPVVAGDAALPGQIYTSQSPTQPGPFTWQMAAGTGGLVAWQHDYAFAVLPPGWSFWTAANVVNVGLTVGIVWEAVYEANIAAPTDAAEYQELVEEVIRDAERAGK